MENYPKKYKKFQPDKKNFSARPYKPRQNYGLDDINSLMVKFVKKSGLEKGLKLRAFSKIWPKIVGPRFQDVSKVVSIVENYGTDTLTIAASSPSVAQELTFHKRDIIRRCYKVGVRFKYNIKDVTFNYKIWDEIQEKLENKGESHIELSKKFTEEEINNIKLPEDIINSIKYSMSELENFDDEMKDKFLNTIIRDLKIQYWQKTNGFPVCKGCGVVLNKFSSGDENLCPSCKYKNC